MTKRSRAILVLLVAAPVLSASLPACRRHDETEVTAVDVADAAPVAMSSVAIPTDKLAPGELLESKTVVFGIPLPVGMTKTLDLNNQEFDMSGPAQQKLVTSFFQARVRGGKLYTGNHSSDFKSVVAPSAPGRLLNIHVEQQDHVLTKVVMTDVTPSDAAVVPPSEAYRLNGITPDGKLVDPQHMQ